MIPNGYLIFEDESFLDSTVAKMNALRKSGQFCDVRLQVCFSLHNKVYTSFGPVVMLAILSTIFFSPTRLSFCTLSNIFTLSPGGQLFLHLHSGHF